jgi:hypothetical protein
VRRDVRHPLGGVEGLLRDFVGAGEAALEVGRHRAERGDVDARRLDELLVRGAAAVLV